jgi:hypothetical protein
MPPFDGKAFGEEIVAAVKFHIDAVTKPLIDQIADLKQQLAEVPRVDEAAIGQIVDEHVAKLPTAEPGKDADPEAVRAIVLEEVARLPPPQPGKDADPETTRALVLGEVEKAVAALPKPKDGESVTLDDVRPLVDDAVSKAVSAIPAAKDGVGLAGAIIDRSGHLVLTLTDGTTRDLGLIVGKDGEPGKSGADGLGWDEMTEELEDDGRTIVRRYMRGDQVKEFRHTMAVVLDRGIYKDGRSYDPGDGVTYAGSFFIAQERTDGRPETSKAWRLSIKRGRDGKDGVLKTEAPKMPLKVG